MNTIKQAENLRKELLDLEKNSRSAKEAHFVAAHRKAQQHKIFGVCIIIANVLIFSPLINFIYDEKSDELAITIKVLAIIGASLASIQTFFNWQKESELHLNAGETYANIYHRSGSLLAKYQDGIINSNDLSRAFDFLQTEYLKANSDYKLNVPSANDYKKADNNMFERSKRIALTVQSPKSLKNLLLEIPEVGEDADFERISDTGRDINL